MVQSMNEATGFILGALFVTVIVALPVAMVWGWLRWWKSNVPRTVSSTLSLIGFALATASALLAISSSIYGAARGGFPYYDPLLMKIYIWGLLLSLSALVFAILGVWRRGPLRWHAPGCAAGTLLLWFVAAISE